MATTHMNQQTLAERWHVSEATLERWRSVGIGPQYLKMHGRVIYREVDIEAFESSCLRTSTHSKVAPPTSESPQPINSNNPPPSLDLSH
jgi:hypothetical protein